MEIKTKLKYTRVLEWALKNSDKMGLKVTKMNWTKDVEGDFCDMEVSIQIKGEEYVGRGFSNDNNEAFVVGLSEAFERFSVKHVGASSSNGFASHINRLEVEENARNEYFERDLFTSIFENDLNLGQKVDLDSVHHPLLSYLMSQEVDLSAYKMSYSDGDFGISLKYSFRNPYSETKTTMFANAYNGYESAIISCLKTACIQTSALREAKEISKKMKHIISSDYQMTLAKKINNMNSASTGRFNKPMIDIEIIDVMKSLPGGLKNGFPFILARAKAKEYKLVKMSMALPYC